MCVAHDEMPLRPHARRCYRPSTDALRRGWVMPLAVVLFFGVAGITTALSSSPLAPGRTTQDVPRTMAWLGAGRIAPAHHAFTMAHTPGAGAIAQASGSCQSCH